MPSIKEYFAILGIKEDASYDEAGKAHRRLALQYHPDKNHSPEASQKFRQIQEAWEALVIGVFKSKDINEMLDSIRTAYPKYEDNIPNFKPPLVNFLASFELAIFMLTNKPNDFRILPDNKGNIQIHYFEKKNAKVANIVKDHEGNFQVVKGDKDIPLDAFIKKITAPSIPRIIANQAKKAAAKISDTVAKIREASPLRDVKNHVNDKSIRKHFKVYSIHKKMNIEKRDQLYQKQDAKHLKNIGDYIIRPNAEDPNKATIVIKFANNAEPIRIDCNLAVDKGKLKVTSVGGKPFDISIDYLVKNIVLIEQLKQQLSDSCKERISYSANKETDKERLKNEGDFVIRPGHHAGFVEIMIKTKEVEPLVILCKVKNGQLTIHAMFNALNNDEFKANKTEYLKLQSTIISPVTLETQAKDIAAAVAQMKSETNQKTATMPTDQSKPLPILPPARSTNALVLNRFAIEYNKQEPAPLPTPQQASKPKTEDAAKTAAKQPQQKLSDLMAKSSGPFKRRPMTEDERKSRQEKAKTATDVKAPQTPRKP